MRDSATARLVSGFERLMANRSVSDAGLHLPIVVVTAGDPWWSKPEIDREWRAVHEANAEAGRGRRLIVAECSRHMVPRDRPETVVEAVMWLAEQPAAGR